MVRFSLASPLFSVPFTRPLRNAAFPLNPASQPCYVDGAAGLGLCGDWCIGPRAGDAWESGQAAARALLAAQSAGELDLGSVV